MRALGAAADGRVSSVGRSSSVRAPNVEVRPGEETLRLLHRDWSGVRDRLYEQIEATADDPVTQDLLIGIAYSIDKSVWQLRAHLG
jgi:DNA-binding ferritin-like protein